MPRLCPEAPTEKLYPGAKCARAAGIIRKMRIICSVMPQKGPGSSGRACYPENWLYEVLAAEEEFKDWTLSLPEEWGLRSLPPCNALEVFKDMNGPRFPKAIYACNGIEPVFGWHAMWCCRIHLLHAMLEYRSTLSEIDLVGSPLASVTRINHELQTMVDNICNTVPFMLGEIDQTGALRPPGKGQAIGAYFLLFSLDVASYVTILPRSQQKWIEDRLSHIGHVFGIQQAFAIRDFHAKQRGMSAGYP